MFTGVIVNAFDATEEQDMENLKVIDEFGRYNEIDPVSCLTMVHHKLYKSVDRVIAMNTKNPMNNACPDMLSVFDNIGFMRPFDTRDFVLFAKIAPDIRHDLCMRALTLFDFDAFYACWKNIQGIRIRMNDVYYFLNNRFTRITEFTRWRGMLSYSLCTAFLRGLIPFIEGIPRGLPPLLRVDEEERCVSVTTDRYLKDEFRGLFEAVQWNHMLQYDICIRNGGEIQMYIPRHKFAVFALGLNARGAGAVSPVRLLCMDVMGLIYDMFIADCIKDQVRNVKRYQ